MHIQPAGNGVFIRSLALAFATTCLWCGMRGYQGLDGDAQIYAFQSLARVDRSLSADLFLQNNSQDRYTIFSPLYAVAIDALGVESAARLLTVIFSIWFYASAWAVARRLSNPWFAWGGIALLIIGTGDYGGSAVFHFAERYLTARLPSEALVMTGLLLRLRGLTFAACLCMIAAILVHPLIGFPGVLVLLALMVTPRGALIGSVGGLLLTLAAAVTASLLPRAAPFVMDSAWLEVVQERSQFLFLQSWSIADWATNLRPLALLAMGCLCFASTQPWRRVCLATLFVGATGLLVALIGSAVGPLAMLVQGQAWRWVWVGGCASTLLLPVLMVHLSRQRAAGPLCAILIGGAWLVPAIVSMACIGAAAALWWQRERLPRSAAGRSRALAVLAAGVFLVWMGWQTYQRLLLPAGFRNPTTMPLLQLAAASAAYVAGFGIYQLRSSAQMVILSLFLAGVLLVWLPVATAGSVRVKSTEEEGLAGWLAEIPKGATVLITPARDVGAFVWFSMRRLNYLALDQSAGVVFSRATSLEIRRRSQVLLPLVNPSWRIRSGMRAAVARPLTASILRTICGDAALDFVLSADDAHYPSTLNTRKGAWQGWHLYNCRTVRASFPGPE